MSYGEALLLTMSFAAVVVAVIAFAQTRLGTRAAIMVWLACACATGVLLLLRPGVPAASGLLPAIFAAVAFLVAWLVIYLRRRHLATGGRLSTAGMAWVALLYVWFQLNYLLAAR